MQPSTRMDQRRLLLGYIKRTGRFVDIAQLYLSLVPAPLSRPATLPLSCPFLPLDVSGAAAPTPPLAGITSIISAVHAGICQQ